MSDKNDACWVLESLVGFLKGPVWNLSILNFIEQKSVIFEPDDDQNDLLEQEYSKVFNEFKQMVDTLLASHMEDLDITPKQFENACLSAKDNLGSKLHAILFEQIWAATNYRIFKRMMIQRNIDLQLQALELLGQKLNVTNEALNASSLSPSSQICEEEFELMRELYKKSVNLTINEETEIITEKKEENNENKNEEEKKEIEEPEKKIKIIRPMSNTKLTPSPFIDKVLNQNQASNSSDQLDNEKKLLILMGDKNGEVNDEELENRQNYLRQQRDKLIELKRKERSKQIAKVRENEIQASRPKSAKAIKESMKKTFINEDEENDEDKKKENENGFAYRKMLAAKLKAELIGGSIGDVIVTPDSIKN